MKVVHINESDRLGGAAIAAYRLHKEMLNYGIDSKMLVQNKYSIGDNTVENISKIDNRFLSAFRSVLERKTIKYKNGKGLFSQMKFGRDITKNLSFKESDVVYLHWVNNGFISYKVLEKILRTNKLVIWFMHDMFPITGGCHHSFECMNYKNNCLKCSFFDSSSKKANRLWNKKNKIISKYKNIVFCSPSKWLYECARSSSIGKNKKVVCIRNLLPENVFVTGGKDFSRKLLNIETDKFVILFGADNALTNPYKGFTYFVEALNILVQKNPELINKIEVLIFGSSYNSEIESKIPFDSKFIGRLNDDYSLSLMYNASDVFVISSLAENYPNTILEALSCDIPVVGFNVGGIPDLVNEKTGYLAKYLDSNDLANGIIKLIGCQYNNEGENQISSTLDRNGKIIEEHKEIWSQYFSKDIQ